jgi:hypothetical protein
MPIYTNHYYTLMYRFPVVTFRNHMTYDSVRREVLCNILFEFHIHTT